MTMSASVDLVDTFACTESAESSRITEGPCKEVECDRFLRRQVLFARAFV